MRIQTLSLLLLLLAGTAICNAQDKIYKKDGTVIDTKIKTVGTKTVTYQKFDNQSGPEYTILKNEITRIVYQNGAEDKFDEDWRPAHHHHSRKAGGDAEERSVVYGPNLLCLAPIQFTENGLGTSVSYERALDKRGIVAFYAPVVVTWDLNNGTHYDYNSGTYVNNHQDMMVYVMPGVKIYPTGSFGIVRYSLGPSLVVATGEKTTSVYNPVGMTGIYDYKTQSHTMLGMVVNNTLNINPGPHVYVGIELGLGFTYLNRVNGLNQDTNGLVQGSFKVGYRF